MDNYYNLSQKDFEIPIYRIISKKRLIDLFVTKTNVLVHPSCWDDPFENLLLKSKVKEADGSLTQYPFHQHVYGQCWTTLKGSDAMWRIYSPNTDGIRIKTTIKKLISSLNKATAQLGYTTCAIGKVNYWSEQKFHQFGSEVFGGLGVKNDHIFESLLVKRKAFSHEEEIRLIYHDVERRASENLYRYEVNPFELVDQLMIDPRLDKTEANKLKHELVELTGFRPEKIKRSLLYAVPPEIIISSR